MEDKTYEVCPHCGEEVELDAELKVQTCPSCGKRIVTCSMCPAYMSDELPYEERCPYCAHCILEYVANKENEKHGRES